MRKYGNQALGALLALALFLAMTVNLESTPPIWWDEGWTLTVARTWVERGTYARLLDGQIVSRGLEAAFPTTASVALGFRLLGVGLWQGRLVAVIFTLAAMALVYFLAYRLYNQKVAWGTMAALLLFSMHPQSNPLIMGRQVLAEPAMLFFLLAGYAFLLLTLQKSLWFLPLVVLFWGVGLNTKAQVEPFWLVSLIAALFLTIWTRRWTKALLLVLVLVGSLEMSQLLFALQAAWVPASLQSSMPVTGLNEVIAFVPDLAMRLFASRIVLTYEIPTMVGLAYAAWKWKEKIGQADMDFDVEATKLALFVLAGSWLAWYWLLSNASIYRYLFPPTFVASIFVAALLYDLTNHFNFRATVEQTGEAIRRLRMNRDSARALLAVMLPAIAVPVSLLMLFYVYFIGPDTSAQQMAEYLNTQTPSDALIETYDSELFFFLNRRYHYPPDQIHVPLVRYNFDQSVTVDYDPMAAKPDYLVTGRSPFSSGWMIYDHALSSGEFKLVRQYGDYTLYERIH